MKLVICLSSYAEIKGMHYDIEVDSTCFDKDEILREASNYYSKLGIEEYFLADFWTDDSDDWNTMALKNYTESLDSFLTWIDKIKNLRDAEAKAALIYNSFTGASFEDIIDNNYYNDVHGPVDPREALITLSEQCGDQPAWMRSLVYRMSTYEAATFATENEITQFHEYDSDFYEIF